MRTPWDSPCRTRRPHSLGLFSRMELFRDTAAGLGVTYVGDRVEPYAGIEAPAYTVVDLFLYRHIGRFAQVQVKLENVFDTVYATSSLFSARGGELPGTTAHVLGARILRRTAMRQPAGTRATWLVTLALLLPGAPAPGQEAFRLGDIAADPGRDRVRPPRRRSPGR